MRWEKTHVEDVFGQRLAQGVDSTVADHYQRSACLMDEKHALTLGPSRSTYRHWS